jgi:hypothetical protein
MYYVREFLIKYILGGYTKLSIHVYKQMHYGRRWGFCYSSTAMSSYL